MTTIEPFAFGGEQPDTDAAIYSRFRQWIAAHRAAQQISGAAEAEPAFEAAIDRVTKLEHQIADTPATGPVGFAIKAYLACHHEHQPRQGDDPAGVSLLTAGYVLDPGDVLDNFVDFHSIAAVIRDAARFVPEIAELAKPVIAPSAEAVAEERVRVWRQISSESTFSSRPQLGAGDVEILAMFRRWLAQCRRADVAIDGDPAWDEALACRDKIEDQIIACQGGPIGLAIKTFLYLRRDSVGWTPSVSQIRGDDLFDAAGAADGPELVSILRDAAAIVPEIAECAAAIIHEDAPLIDAEMTVQWFDLIVPDQPGPDEHPGWRADVTQRLQRALERIASTPANTPRGQAIKARYAGRSVTVPRTAVSIVEEAVIRRPDGTRWIYRAEPTAEGGS